MNERQKEIFWGIAVLTCIGAGFTMMSDPSEPLLALCFLILGSFLFYYGVRNTFEKDFYVNWYTRNAQIYAEAKSMPFDKQKEREKLKQPFWKLYLRYSDGPPSLVFGIVLLLLAGGILWKYIF